MSTGLGAGRGRAFGSGWISGVLSVMLAGLAYGGVLCLLFPDALTTPAARPLYPMGLVHALIHVFLVAGFGLGVLSIVLRRRKTLGLTGVAMAVAATLLGGAGVEPDVAGTWRAWAGLDWFLLNLLSARARVRAARAPVRRACPQQGSSVGLGDRPRRTSGQPHPGAR